MTTSSPRPIAVAAGLAVTLLVIVVLAYVCSHLARSHSGWREGLADLLSTIAWMPAMGLGFWAYVRVESWLAARNQRLQAAGTKRNR